MINLLIQLFFVLLLIILLAVYAFIIYAARRASTQTTIPIPKGWERIMIGTLVTLLITLTFVVIIRP